MDKQGIVSVWIGNIKDQSALEKYVNITYDDEGEAVSSKFFLDFNVDIDDVDEDFIEKTVLHEPSKEISVIAEGCSYEEVVIPRLKNVTSLKHEYNSVILIYDYEYNKAINTAEGFSYIESVSYSK